MNDWGWDLVKLLMSTATAVIARLLDKDDPRRIEDIVPAEDRLEIVARLKNIEAAAKYGPRG